MTALSVPAEAPAKRSFAVAEMRMTNGVTLTGKFDGEFASRSAS